MTTNSTENATKTRFRDDHGRFVKSSESRELVPVTLSADEFTQINNALARLETDNYKMSEKLQNVDLMIDERGWNPIYDYGVDGGMTLSQLRSTSVQLRELAIANPTVKRGSQLRNASVWGSGIEFSAKDRSGKVTKLPPRIQDLMEKPRNVRALFSADAQEELERCAFTDGNLFALGNDVTKDFQRIPISQITADFRNPDDPSEIWAYRRSWSQDPVNHPDAVQVRWYFTDVYDGRRPRSIEFGGAREAVDVGKTMFDKRFNGQVGWGYGIPDALAIIAWARLYKEFLVNGYIMSRALAQLAYKVTTANARGAANAALSIAQPQQEGATAVMGSGNDLTPLATAGKGYDFNSGRPLAAMIAAGLEVSLVSLLSDPGAGGGSYGTAQTLIDPQRATGQMRRKSWDDFWLRIFRYLGNNRGLQVTWHDLTDEQLQRILQSWTQVHNSGLFKAEIVQTGMAQAMGIPDPGAIPKGYMLPNNSESLNRKDVDSDGNPANPGDAPSGTPSAGTGQGQGDGTTGPLGNDHSTD